jgi:hypothetical protein
VIKIEFSGSGEEVRNEMLRLLGLQESHGQGDAAKEGVSKEDSTQPAKVKGRRQRRARKAEAAAAAIWTENDAEKLLKQIKPNAKRIMTELATKPEGYRISELAQALGLNEGAIRGQLSSVGFALRRMDGKPSPIKREKNDGELTYKLNATVAATAQQTAG